VTAEEVREVINRIDGIWPPRKPPTQDERAEWVRFLQPLEAGAAVRGVDLMRECLKFRPSMADFRDAYYEAAALPGDDMLALPPAEGSVAPHLTDTYGHRVEEWVFCWRCDRALSLDDYDGHITFDERRGLRHIECPSDGSAPIIPTRQRLEREAYWRKMKIGREG
jgi:hypothetical protein